jgi:hypothetical protein
MDFPKESEGKSGVDRLIGIFLFSKVGVASACRESVCVEVDGVFGMDGLERLEQLVNVSAQKR